MRKAEIDALVRAHQGRVQPVAFFHVLRQPALEPDDHAFLSENIRKLGASDLMRWRSRCEPGFTGAIIQELARLAIETPEYFHYEVLSVPRLELEEEEWIDLADRIRGKVSDAIYERVLARCRREPVVRASGFMFTPGVIPSTEPLLDDADGPEPGHPAEPDETRLRSITQILIDIQAGTLRMDDAALVALAFARAKRSSEDWSRGVRELPPILRDAIIEKTRRTPRGAERVNLLAWLSAQGASRAALLEIALEAFAVHDISHPEIVWLSRQLTTRAAWERHGPEAVSVLMKRRAFGELSELITVTWSDSAREAGDIPRGLVDAIQVAFAITLLEMTREALAASDERRALATLSALVCLDPPSRLSRAVHDLRRFEGASPAVMELLAVNERLVKHSDARDASLEGVVAALHAIADTFG